MSRSRLLAVLVCTSYLLFPVYGFTQEPQTEIVFSSHRDILDWVMSTDHRVTGEGPFNLVFNLPNLPLKATFKVPPYVMKARFWPTGEAYDISLFVMGLGFPAKNKSLPERIHVFIYFDLKTDVLKPEHFDLFLQARRNGAPVGVVGYIRSRELELKKHPEFPNDFLVNLIIHPQYINGIPVE